MEELLEMITWCQLGIHDKPVSTLINAYWTDRHMWLLLKISATSPFQSK
jgi:predicted Rossmann-fold nucleotide-binding protein